MDCCITKIKFGEVVLTTSFFSESEACLGDAANLLI